MKYFFVLFNLLLIANKTFAINFTDAQLENACRKARSFNQEGKIPQAYAEFAKIGDAYAQAAQKIFDTSKDSLERCVIQAHWLTVVGKDVKDRYFDKYGKQYQSNYINLVCSERKLPKTDRIEKLYGDTLLYMGLPDALSIDKVLNQQPKNSMFRYVQNTFCNLMTGKGLHYSQGEWYDAIALGNDRSRVAKRQYKAEVSKRYADWLAFTTSMRTALVSPGCFEAISIGFAKAAHAEVVDWAGNMLLDIFGTSLYRTFGAPPTNQCEEEQRMEINISP